MSKLIPTSSKLTLKGDTSDKVASKGIDPATLENYTVSLFDEGKPMVDIQKEADTIGKKVVEFLASQKNSSGVDFGTILDQVNGKGYVANLAKRISHDVMELALGTAPQTRAYKDTLCANTALEASDFVSTKGKASTGTAKANPFG